MKSFKIHLFLPRLEAKSIRAMVPFDGTSHFLHVAAISFEVIGGDMEKPYHDLGHLDTP